MKRTRNRPANGDQPLFQATMAAPIEPDDRVPTTFWKPEDLQDDKKRRRTRKVIQQEALIWIFGYALGRASITQAQAHAVMKGAADGARTAIEELGYSANGAKGFMMQFMADLDAGVVTGFQDRAADKPEE